MRVDYTKIFATPDKLADFLLLDVEEQDRILFELAVVGKTGGMNTSCDVGKNIPETKKVPRITVRP